MFQNPMSNHLCMLHDNLIGLVPPLSKKSECHLGRLAILKEARGSGFGKLLVQAVHEEARHQGFGTSSIHAQTYAIPFYEKVGYKIDPENSEIFFECGIEHVSMVMELQNQNNDIRPCFDS